MAACLSGGEYQVVLTVIDQTWGFKRQSALISLKEFENATNLTRQGVIKAIKRAEARHIIARRKDGTKGTEYLFNKHYDTWITGTSEQEFTSESSPLVNESSLDTSEREFTSESPPLVNESSPDKSTGVYQTSERELTSTSKLPTPATEPVKKYIIENSKEILIESDKILAEISTLYSENIGVIKPALADELREFCESFRGPVAWIKPAFKEALSRNKKSWGYVRAILEDWEEKGGPDDDKDRGRPGSGRGHGRPARKPQPRRHPITYITGSGKPGEQKD